MQRGARIGARRKSDLDPAVLQYLNSGVAESATHIEQMCLDMVQLFNAAFPAVQLADSVSGEPFIRRLRSIGATLARSAVEDPPNSCWISDTVRGWHAMAIGESPLLDDDQRLEAMARYYTDHHFAVREWSWLALRPRVVERPREWVSRIAPLLHSQCPLTRRFAVELVRPRSVWGAHLETVKADPAPIGDLLVNLRCDESAYVRNAVGNWFNDASRSQPEWVRRRMSEWLDSCECVRTRSIVRRATRSIPEP